MSVPCVANQVLTSSSHETGTVDGGATPGRLKSSSSHESAMIPQSVAVGLDYYSVMALLALV